MIIYDIWLQNCGSDKQTGYFGPIFALLPPPHNGVCVCVCVCVHARVHVCVCCVCGEESKN